MNKLLFLLAAMAVVLPVSAGGQFKSHGSQADYRPLSPDEITMNGNSLNMITDASDEVPVVISEVPEGTLLTYHRTGGYIYHKFLETGITEFEDDMNVVFADEGERLVLSHADGLAEVSGTVSFTGPAVVTGAGVGADGSAARWRVASPQSSPK